MKQWTTPEISELNINETANGIIPVGQEIGDVFNDKTLGEVIEDWVNGNS